MGLLLGFPGVTVGPAVVGAPGTLGSKKSGLLHVFVHHRVLVGQGQTQILEVLQDAREGMAELGGSGMVFTGSSCKLGHKIQEGLSKVSCHFIR
jgi:hypothetical protein